MIPFACGMGLCSNNCLTHKGWVYIFPHTCKTKTKRLITNPKKSIEKTKNKGKNKTNNKKKINKIFKNYKKQKKQKIKFKKQKKDKHKNFQKKEKKTRLTKILEPPKLY